MHWLKNEPWREEASNTTWRTLDSGLRAVYWIRAMALCTSSPAVTEEVTKTFLQGLKQIALRLMNNSRRAFSRKSNWGVMEYTGIYLLGYVLDDSEYRRIARTYLRDQLHLRILDDGMQWEASTMYHNEELMVLLESMRIAEIWQRGLP